MYFVNEGIPSFSIDTFRFTNLFETVKKIKNAKILELGCGSGVISKFLSSKNTVYALDIEDYSQAFKGTSVTFIQHNLEEGLPFRSESFDYVLAIEVLEHINNLGNLLGEIYRVLKFNGILFAETPNITWNYFCDILGLFFFVYNKLTTPVYCDFKNRYKASIRKSKHSFLLEKFRMLDVYMRIATYSKRFHIHKHSFLWWKSLFETNGFIVEGISGVHIFPLLSFFPITIQKRIYNYERRKSNSAIVRFFSSVCLFKLRKGEI
jgi:ubiquinone/menaquinone biosynthesis C-methylase UbiE